MAAEAASRRWIRDRGFMPRRLAGQRRLRLPRRRRSRCCATCQARHSPVIVRPEHVQHDEDDQTNNEPSHALSPPRDDFPAPGAAERVPPPQARSVSPRGRRRVHQRAPHSASAYATVTARLPRGSTAPPPTPLATTPGRGSCAPPAPVRPPPPSPPTGTANRSRSRTRSRSRSERASVVRRGRCLSSPHALCYTAAGCRLMHLGR